MQESKSVYGKGFAIRMVALLTVLAAVAIGFYQDNQLIKNASQKIDQLMNTLTRQENGLTKAAVRREFGFDPADSQVVDSYEVEQFEFGRVLPFSRGQFIKVVYRQGQVYQAVANRASDPDSKDRLALEGVKVMPPEERTMPRATVADSGGGGTSRDAAQIVARIMRGDGNQDGALSIEEVSEMKERFEGMDQDGDGVLTKQEVEKVIRDRARQRNDSKPADEAQITSEEN